MSRSVDLKYLIADFLREYQEMISGERCDTEVAYTGRDGKPKYNSDGPELLATFILKIIRDYDTTDVQITQ